MSIQPADPEPPLLNLLRRMLSNDEEFSLLLDEFVGEAVSAKAPPDADLRRVYKNSLLATARESARHIAETARSSLERTFIRSLLLAYLWSDGLGLVSHPIQNDASAEIASFRASLARFAEIRVRFLKQNPRPDLSAFLDHQAATGEITWEERRSFAPLVGKYRFGRLDKRVHMTMQARFPNIRVHDHSVVADVYLWVPKRPDINIIVECDGFPYHSSEERFTRDRQRDRVFQANGYEVLRFSGSEIRRDPVQVANELVAHLRDRARRPKVSTAPDAVLRQTAG
jgi:very-short-patch-repair endonuclease